MLGQLPADQMMNAIEAFYVQDALQYAEIEELKNHRDHLRAEMIRYTNIKGSGDGKDDPTPTAYLEPNEDGTFPGLEDGFMGG